MSVRAGVCLFALAAAPLAFTAAALGRVAAGHAEAIGSAREVSLQGTGLTHMSHHWTAEPAGGERTTEAGSPRPLFGATSLPPGADPGATTPVAGVPPVGPTKDVTPRR